MDPEVLTLGEISSALLGNSYLASVVGWISDKELGVKFLANDIHQETRVTYSIVTPILNRLVTVDLITRHERMPTSGTRGPLPYSRNDHPFWRPYGELCRMIIESSK
ncbi:MAG TPA: hypothetical protein VLG47_06535 [Candidatus Saccharimonadales bacterium]|nr:hypothetical protein [Candidatus Saccharimonadales bacterium]